MGARMAAMDIGEKASPPIANELKTNTVAVVHHEAIVVCFLLFPFNKRKRGTACRAFDQADELFLQQNRILECLNQAF